MKVLIVDDDLVSRQILSHVCKPFCQYDIAVNGMEAVQLFMYAHEKNEPYELIFLDIMMPKLSGHEVLKQIRAFENKKGILLGEGVKIAMITALNDKSSVFKSFKEGCETYLVKPIKKNDVIDLIQGQMK